MRRGFFFNIVVYVEFGTDISISEQGFYLDNHTPLTEKG